MNKITLVGRLGQDPELKSTTTGKEIANFSLATKDGFGEYQRTNWHNIVVFGKSATSSATYLKKGSLAAVDGHVEYRSWDDKQTGQKKYRTEIIADRVEFLSSVSGEAKSQPDGFSQIDDPITDEDIPF